MEHRMKMVVQVNLCGIISDGLGASVNDLKNASWYILQVFSLCL